MVQLVTPCAELHHTRYDQGVGDPFPFLWYRTQYVDSEEVSLRVLFQQDVVPERLEPALSGCPCPF